MAVEVSYYGKDGKERTFVLEEGDDTNLMFGGAKSNFSLFRSGYDDEGGERRQEFWMWLDGQFFLHQYRPTGRPAKAVFDSRRTAIAAHLPEIHRSAWGYDKYGLYYVGGSETSQTGNFSVYGCVVNGERWVSGRNYVPYMFMCAAVDRPLGNYAEVMAFLREDGNTLIEDFTGALVQPSAITERGFAMDFSGKVAEVRDWEIVSNDTPEENTYYVVVENRKGDIVDVITTHGFGQTVNVGGKDYVVKYDMVIRPGR